MINKRLIGGVPESKKYVAATVVLNWIALMANIWLMAAVTRFLSDLAMGKGGREALLSLLLTALCCVPLRAICTVWSGRTGFEAGKAVKKTLRRQIYQKLLRLGARYTGRVSTSEVVQVAVEGVEQLETYFGSYLPQLFYAMLAPVTLFAVLAHISLKAALILMVAVPLIPISIAAVQTWAKKLLTRYWGQYAALGDTFLENLQGLTTLKIYQADAQRHRKMNQESERFRVITMQVLSMQLNSITIMDLIAYGGAALGMAVATGQHAAGQVDLQGCLLIILLAADFFLPMRLLGSYFHIAMNGMAAGDKIFKLLDLQETGRGDAVPAAGMGLSVRDLSFAYDGEHPALQGLNADFKPGSLTAVVGESGCGKSTLAQILTGGLTGYSGSACAGGAEIAMANEEELMRYATYVGHASYLFKGTVRENLLLAAPESTDAQLWRVLERMNLADYLRSEQGLDTMLAEQAENLSGGQRQRLCMARAFLHDSPVYVFDEATSNIDAESERVIMNEIGSLRGTKTVLLISHRLANASDADQILVMKKGRLAEAGTHAALLRENGVYAALWHAQQELENYGKEHAKE